MVLEYPATQENGLEAITAHTMCSEPSGEQIGKHCALNLPIMTVQDRTDPINQGLHLIHFFLVRVSYHNLFSASAGAQWVAPTTRFTRKRDQTLSFALSSSAW